MKCICFIILVFSIVQAKAQDGPLNKGDLYFNGGIGIGSFLGSKSETSTVPPLSVSGEYAISENVTMGGILGYYGSEYSYRSSSFYYTYRFSHKLIGARINYYYELSDKLNVYGGAGLGYNVVGFKTVSSNTSLIDDDDYSTSGVFYTLHLGGRYEFSKRLGAFAELGYGFTALNLGLSLKLSK